MRIKGIKIDEDVARILNEQDNDDTSKYRVYSNDIKEAIELPMDIPNEPYIEVTLDYGRPLLGYRLIDGVLYYTGRNGTKQIGKNVTLDNLAKRILSHAKNITKMNIDKIEVDDKVIWDYADGFINESINEEVLPHNLPKLNKLIDRLNNSGYWKVNGDEIRVDHGFGTVAEQMDLTDLADEFRKIGFKVYVSHFSIQVDGLKDYMEKQNNKNESINEDYEEDDYEDVTEEMHKEIYVTYFETQEGRQRYTIYHVYTDSTDDSYNELCDKRDNQLGMYDSYKKLRDALKERAEKIAEQRGWTVKSIENLGEDDEYYRERNKWESIKEDWPVEDIDKYNKERITKVKQILEKQFKRLGFTDVKWNEAKQLYFFKYLDEPYYIVINTPGINGTGYNLYKASDYGVAKGRLLTYREVWLMPKDVTPFVRAILSDIHKFILLNESMKEGFNIGDKIWRRNPETQDRMIGEVIDKSESINEAGKCTWHAWQEGKKYACIDDCTYGHIDDFIGMEEDIEKFVKAGWVNANGEIVIPAGAEFQVRKLHTPNGIVLYFPDVDMELDTGLDEDDYTLYEIINEAKTMKIDEDVARILNEQDNDFPEGSFAAWYGEDLSGQTYEGDLYCSGQNLMSLFGCPSVVIGDFDCTYNQLTSLEGAPKEVEGDFDCSRNKLTSLKGAPKEVGESFDCSYNQLTSLEGSPEKVGGYFNCYSNYLTSLESAPEKVGGYFSCSNNQLTSLKGSPKEVGGDFYCNNNKLTSLEGSPKEVAGDLYCYDNRLMSLDGIGGVEGEVYSNID